MVLSIVLPTDGSESALRAARWLSQHLAERHAAVTLLHVMAPSLELAQPEGLAAARELSEKILEDTQAALGCCPCTNAVTVIGVPHEEIVRFAVDHNADLIVMGRRGGSRLNHWIGSVSFVVFQRSPIPVTFVETE
jgi:nucleotide-binding universal stress UspA family protein